jgi:hypothetical protein
MPETISGIQLPEELLMYLRITPLRRAVLRAALRLSSAGAIVAPMLAAGCEDTLVPAVEAHLGTDGPGDDETDPQHDKCFLSLLYEVEGDLFRFKGGAAQLIDPHSGGGSGGGGGLAGEPAVGISQELYGYDGFVRLLADGQVVAELTIDRAFLEADRVEVLAYDAPTGTRFEYHLYTQPDCDEPWLPEQEVLTREEVEAREK